MDPDGHYNPLGTLAGCVYGRDLGDISWLDGQNKGKIYTGRCIVFILLRSRRLWDNLEVKLSKTELEVSASDATQVCTKLYIK